MALPWAFFAEIQNGCEENILHWSFFAATHLAFGTIPPLSCTIFLLQECRMLKFGAFLFFIASQANADRC
jgi:hypothetical protein